MVQAQGYWAIAENHENGSNVYLDWVSLDFPWVHLVPYADGGGSVLDSQPVFYVVEFYVTAFDRLIRDSPEKSLVSNLFADKTIGFSMGVTDSDMAPLELERGHTLSGPNDSWGGEWVSDLWAHGILLDADDGTDGTAAESTTWARIKASLSE